MTDLRENWQAAQTDLWFSTIEEAPPAEILRLQRWLCAAESAWMREAVYGQESL